ncbi:hypothetical protein E1A91_A05G381100v1 [Gossypium mustelinum]|uniref:Uncharacterized protein n=1 Tax=Gossypium mustelinum TaxID=34275 RepID=A0A5D2ZHB6_GOSMU|nr:hypothetical protein E1A91_A05G381100v1 [Gossypium mustelinum]
MAVDSSPASRVSWKDKLLGGSVSNSLDGDANIDLKFVEGDICRSNLNGIPTIDFSDHTNKILIKRMELTVAVKLIGCNIGYGALFNRITSLWTLGQCLGTISQFNCGLWIFTLQDPFPTVCWLGSAF